MPKRSKKRYPVDQCALYRCGSKRRLFQLLQTTASKFAELQSAEQLYTEFTKAKKDGTHRHITAPRHDLKRIQARISELLQRVETPDYLFAPARGRSHIDNAAAHRGARSFHLLDVQDFFPSCSARNVAWFFSSVLECPPDVTAILVWLTTLEGSLPQGSPASSPLAFHAYRDMWDEISALAKQAGNTLGVYADDITLSGTVVRGSLVYGVKERLKHHGHSYKEEKEVSLTNSPAAVTGVVIHGDLLLVPNAQRHKQWELRRKLNGQNSKKEQKKLIASLAGRVAQSKQIELKNAQPLSQPARAESTAL